MIPLPAALSPWSRQLSVFPAELGLAIGPLIQRIAAAIDPLHLEDLPGADDPDGFDGLINRGSYDRLIVSDWLLADEVPEEFDRRAAMREHLFLKTARRDRAHGVGSIVLFDCGPDQLGSPRLAHLAILIVLLRRAERARGNFSWGILQNGGMPLFHGSSEAEIVELLRARTYASVSEPEIRAWVSRALELNKPEEVWLVGGPRLHRFSPDHLVSRIRVEDTLDPEARQVSVEIHRTKGRPRKMLLDLPDHSACARLLRDPYQLAVAILQKFTGSATLSGLIFGHTNRNAFAVAGDGTLLSFPIPGSPRDTAGHATQHRNLGEIVAANRLGRSTVVVTLEGTALYVSYLSRRSNYPLPGHYFLQDDQFNWPHRGLSPCVRTPMPPGTTPSLLVLDQARNLFRLQQTPRSAAFIEAANVLTLTSVGGLPGYIALNDSARTVEYTLLGVKAFRAPLLADCDSIERAFIGFSAHVERPFCLLAIQRDDRAWLVIPGKGKVQEIRTEQSQEVAGVIQEEHYAEALLTLRDNRHIVTLKGSNWERTLLESADPIVHVAVSQSKPLIAYSTSKGDVAVHSVSLGRSLCRFVNRERDE